MFLLEELGSQGSLVPGVVEKPGGGLTFVPAPDLGGSLCGWPLRAPADRPMAIAFAIVYGSISHPRFSVEKPSQMIRMLSEVNKSFIDESIVLPFTSHVKTMLAWLLMEKID